MSRKITLIVGIFFALIFVSSCSSTPTIPARPTEPKSGPTATEKVASTSATANDGGILVRAMTSEPAQIDPQGAPNSGLSLVIPYLFDTLVVRDTENRLLPSLAETWQVSDDGKSITMKLKAGVAFQDGNPLNAEAVRFTFQRFKDTGLKSPIYSGIQQISGIEVVDDLTVRFSFPAPAANFWSTISMPYAGIISPASARSQSGRLIGTGPFMLEEWKSGQSITLKRNSAYRWGPAVTENRGAPHIDKMIFKVIPDATTQMAALQAGEIDAMFINEPSQVARLQKDPSVHLEKAVLNSLIYLGFNCRKAPFDDVRVRQALSLSIDKDSILKMALGGVGLIAWTPLPPSLPGYDVSLKEAGFGFEPQKAKGLLAEAGFSQEADGTWRRSGQPLKGVLITSNRAPNDTIAQLLQSQLKAIGVPVEIQQLDGKAVMDASSQGNFDLLLWRYDWNDPDALNIFLGSDQIGGSNRVAYSNPTVDKLLKLGAQELDETKRNRTYVEAQKIILQDAPWQPLYVPTDVLAISTRIKGVKIGYMGRMLVNDAEVVSQ